MARRNKSHRKYRKRQVQTRKNKRARGGGPLDSFIKAAKRAVANNTTNVALPNQYKWRRHINCQFFLDNQTKFNEDTPIPGDFDSYWIAYRNNVIPLFIGNDTRCEVFYNLGTVTSWKCESFKTKQTVQACKLYLNYFTFVSGNQIAFMAQTGCDYGNFPPCDAGVYNDVISQTNPNIWGPNFTFYKYIE